MKLSSISTNIYLIVIEESNAKIKQKVSASEHDSRRFTETQEKEFPDKEKAELISDNVNEMLALLESFDSVFFFVLLRLICQGSGSSNDSLTPLRNPSLARLEHEKTRRISEVDENQDSSSSDKKSWSLQIGRANRKNAVPKFYGKFLIVWVKS